MTPSDRDSSRAFYAPPRLTGPERAMQYARAVVGCKIKPGKKVRAACKRFLDDLKKIRPHWGRISDCVQINRLLKRLEIAKPKWHAIFVSQNLYQTSLIL